MSSFFNKNLLSGYLLAGLPFLFSVWTVSIIARDLGVRGRGEVVVLTLIAALWGTASGLGVPWASREIDVSKFSIDQLWWRATLLISFIMTTSSVLIGLSIFGTSHEYLFPILTLLIVNSLTSVRTFQASMIMQKYGTWVNSVLGISSQVVFLILIEFYGRFGVLTVSLVLIFQAITLFATIAGSTLITMKIDIPVSKKMSFGLEQTRILLYAFYRQAKDAFLSKIDLLLLLLISMSYRSIGLYSVAGILFQLSYQITSQALYSSYSKAMSPRIRLRYTMWRSLIPVFAICLIVKLTSSAWIPILFGDEFLAAEALFVPVTLGCMGLTIWVLTNALDEKQSPLVFPCQIITSAASMLIIQSASNTLEASVWGIGLILLSAAIFNLVSFLRKNNL